MVLMVSINDEEEAVDGENVDDYDGGVDGAGVVAAVGA